MKFNELIENVKGWSTAKELDKASPLSQMLKLNEEWGSLMVLQYERIRKR